MKKMYVFGLVAVLLLPLLVVGLTSGNDNNSNGVPDSGTVEITLEELAAQNDITKNIEIACPGTVTVRLGANPTTGYSWAVADISNPGGIVMTSNNYEGPDTNLLGASGTEVWVFGASDTGSATIKMNYGRPWEGGDKDLYTVTINVNIK